LGSSIQLHKAVGIKVSIRIFLLFFFKPGHFSQTSNNKYHLQSGKENKSGSKSGIVLYFFLCLSISKAATTNTQLLTKNIGINKSAFWLRLV
jgi:hypothetical protein